MALTLPVCSGFQVFVAIIVPVRQVGFLKPFPSVLALFWRPIRIFINQVLEFIYCNTIWQKLQAISQMGVLIFIGVFLKEELHPWPCEKFHAHRMDFCGFTCWEYIFRYSDMAAGICLECMTGFVCQHIYITRGAIKVRKNKWCFIVTDKCAVTTSFFSFFRFKIQ